MEMPSSKTNLSFTSDIKDYLNGLKGTIDNLGLEQINIVIEKIIDAYQNEKFIYIFGNGGSASTASHFVNDFNKGLSENLKKKFRMICLNDNIPLMLAISNDVNYHQVFKRQLENFLNSEDLVIGISGSGNSRNIIEAIQYAKGAYTIGLVGFGGGELKKTAKYCIHVPVYDMQQVEDVHLAINHLIVRVLTNYLHPSECDSFTKPQIHSFEPYNKELTFL